MSRFTSTSPELQMLRNHTFDELNIGDSDAVQRTLTNQDIQLFAVMSGDVNPAHLDADYAAGTRFHGVIAHGMWGGALISAVLGTRLPGPGTVYLGQTLRFRLPVHLGDTLTVRVTVSAKDEVKKVVTLFCSCVNQDGQTVIDGEATVLAPSEKIRRPANTLPEVSISTVDACRS
jgi:acyl dehydratase